jgi:DNA-binding NarL/FixJ family response regulator
MRSVLRMKLEGCTNDEIAQVLGVSERTIERKCMLIREHARRLDVTTSTRKT